MPAPESEPRRLFPELFVTDRESLLGIDKVEPTLVDKPSTEMASELPVIELDVPVRCRFSSCRVVEPVKMKPAAVMAVPDPPFCE